MGDKILRYKDIKSMNSFLIDYRVNNIGTQILDSYHMQVHLSGNYILLVISSPNYTSPPSTVAIFFAIHLMMVLQPSVSRSLIVDFIHFYFLSFIWFLFFFYFLFSIFRTAQVRGYQLCCHISHKLMA